MAAAASSTYPEGIERVACPAAANGQNRMGDSTAVECATMETVLELNRQKSRPGTLLPLTPLRPINSDRSEAERCRLFTRSASEPFGIFAPERSPIYFDWDRRALARSFVSYLWRNIFNYNGTSSFSRRCVLMDS